MNTRVHGRWLRDNEYIFRKKAIDEKEERKEQAAYIPQPRNDIEAKDGLNTSCHQYDLLAINVAWAENQHGPFGQVVR